MVKMFQKVANNAKKLQKVLKTRLVYKKWIDKYLKNKINTSILLDKVNMLSINQINAQIKIVEM